MNGQSLGVVVCLGTVNCSLSIHATSRSSLEFLGGRLLESHRFFLSISILLTQGEKGKNECYHWSCHFFFIIHCGILHRIFLFQTVVPSKTIMSSDAKNSSEQGDLSWAKQYRVQGKDSSAHCTAFLDPVQYQLIFSQNLNFVLFELFWKCNIFSYFTLSP